MTNLIWYLNNHSCICSFVLSSGFKKLKSIIVLEWPSMLQAKNRIQKSEDKKSIITLQVHWSGAVHFHQHQHFWIVRTTMQPCHVPFHVSLFFQNHTLPYQKYITIQYKWYNKSEIKGREISFKLLYQYLDWKSGGNTQKKKCIHPHCCHVILRLDVSYNVTHQ